MQWFQHILTPGRPWVPEVVPVSTPANAVVHCPKTPVSDQLFERTPTVTPSMVRPMSNLSNVDNWTFSFSLERISETSVVAEMLVVDYLLDLPTDWLYIHVHTFPIISMTIVIVSKAGFLQSIPQIVCVCN
jgi:hypothetical protein